MVERTGGGSNAPQPPIEEEDDDRADTVQAVGVDGSSISDASAAQALIDPRSPHDATIVSLSPGRYIRIHESSSTGVSLPRIGEVDLRQTNEATASESAMGISHIEDQAQVVRSRLADVRHELLRGFEAMSLSLRDDSLTTSLPQTRNVATQTDFPVERGQMTVEQPLITAEEQGPTEESFEHLGASGGGKGLQGASSSTSQLDMRVDLLPDADSITRRDLESALQYMCHSLLPLALHYDIGSLFSRSDIDPLVEDMMSIVSLLEETFLLVDDSKQQLLNLTNELANISETEIGTGDELKIVNLLVLRLISLLTFYLHLFRTT